MILGPEIILRGYIFIIIDDQEVMERSVVVVTGGAGFLGQHVVKLLQTHADYVLEIRVLDVCPFVQNLNYAEQKPVQHYVGSVTDTDLVHEVCRGADCVIHLASFIDYSMFPDEETSYKVNVEGTRNVISACLDEGVSRLIYCSTIETVKSARREIFGGTEDNTRAPEHNHFLFKAYGPTKKLAEDLISQASCEKLKTASLRIVPMYGELEPRMAPALTNCIRAFGYYFAASCGRARTSYSYVGNTAWAFLCADRALQAEKAPGLNVTGKVFYIGDETPDTNVFDTLKPFILEAGCKQFPVKIPFWLLLYPMYLLFLIISIIRVVYKTNIGTGIAAIYGMNKTYEFRSELARRYLDYKPMFSYLEGKRLTSEYYRQLLTVRQKQ